MADTLDFEPTERVSWRRNMTVSQMLDDITKFQEEYKTGRTLADQEIRMEIKEELLLEYFTSIMEGEEIGVQSESETRQIMEEMDAEEDKQSQSPTPEIVVSDADAGAMPAESGGSTSSLPSSLEMDRFMDNNSDSPKGKKNQETINLFKAYKHIKSIFLNERRFNQRNSQVINVGLLDVEKCILETHKILMSNLIDKEHGSRPGTFSKNKRRTGDGFEYPHFLSEDLAEAAIQQLVDRHNDTLNKMECIEDKKERVKYLFKCTSLFLNGFLLLHPFPDGNGRIARLLCGYMLLRSVFPFTLPIYNVYSSSTREDYIQALIQARKLDCLPKTVGDKNEAYRAANVAWEQKPELLCSMIIESNWCVWRKYREMLEAERPDETQEVAN